MKVLFRLGDDWAARRVVDSLNGDDATSRTIGIARAQYAKTEQLVPRLTELLTDSRDAARLGPQEGPAKYVRVQDLAANTIAELLGLDRSQFKRSSPSRYDRAELDRLNILAQQKLAEK